MNRMAKVAMLLVLLGATKRLSSFNRHKRKRRAPQSESEGDPRAKRRRYASNSSIDDDSDISSLESDISDDLDLLTESESESSDSFDSSSSSSFDDDEEDDEDSLDDLDDESGDYVAANGFETEEDETVDPLSLDSPDVDSEFEVKEEPVDELDSNAFSCLFNVPVKEEPEVHFTETTAEEILRDR